MFFARNVTWPEPLAPGPAQPDQAPRIVPRPHGPEKPSGRWRWWLAGAVLAAIAAAVYLRESISTRLQPAPPVAIRTATVRTGDLEQSLRLTGTTAAGRRLPVFAPNLTGRRLPGTRDFQLVLEHLAKPGAQVRKNDVVAEFDRLAMVHRLDDYRASRIDHEFRLHTRRAALDVRRAAHQQRIRQAKARMDKAALDLKTAPVRSAMQIERYRLALEEAKATHASLVYQTRYLDESEDAQMRYADLDLRESQLEERRARENVEKMVARAPDDGFVVASHIFRGTEYAPIEAGDQLRSGQTFLEIVDPRSMIVEASANQADIEQLRLGARARVRFDAHPDLELPARVHAIGMFAKSHRYRGNYVSEVPVFLKLERVDPRVTPSLSVSADVILQSEPRASIVPRAAIFRGGKSGQPFAYVQTASGWEKRTIELGLTNNVEAAVRSGLSPGDVVALAEPPA